MEKKRVTNELFDTRYLLGIKEDLSVKPGELEALKLLLEEYDRSRMEESTGEKDSKK